MPTMIFNFFSSYRYEDVVAETGRFLKSVPESATANYVRAQALYHLGQYDEAIQILERALAGWAQREPEAVRLQLGALLANVMIEKGWFGAARALAERSVPETAAAREEKGEMLLAAAWAAYFDRSFAAAFDWTARIFALSGEHFTCGRAALCAALAARQGGETDRGAAYLLKARHHLLLAQNLLGHPGPVRQLYLTQVDVARHRSSEALVRADLETAQLPATTKITVQLREAIKLYRLHLGGTAIGGLLAGAAQRGVKRTWVALLHPLPRPASPAGGPPAPAAPAAPAAADAARAQRLAALPVRTPEDDAAAARHAADGAIAVLHVESNRKSAHDLADCLRDSRFEIAARVTSFEMALDKYLRARPALVVLDLLAAGVAPEVPRGPFLSIRQLREVDPHCKVVVTWTPEYRPWVAAALRDGARADLAKPFAREQLLATLQKALAPPAPAQAAPAQKVDLARPLACTWQAMEKGSGSLLGFGRPVQARSIDPAGLEAIVEGEWTTGEAGELRLELPSLGGPLTTFARLVSCREETSRPGFAVRFAFIGLPPEKQERLLRFMSDARAAGQIAPR